MHASLGMFIGHYGPAYAIKRWRPEIPLFVLFVAVQLVDVAWAILVPLGIEKVRIVPGITKTNPLDLYYMPYTHSLIGALLWAVAAAVAYGLWKKRARWLRVAPPVALAVFSHWLLDWLVHRPDLSLFGGSTKVGLGLWNYPVVALALEVGSVLAGLVLYLGVSRARDGVGRWGPWVFVALLCAIQLVMFFGRPPETPDQAAGAALASYLVFAAIAAWLDEHRAPGSPERARQLAAVRRNAARHVGERL